MIPLDQNACVQESSWSRSLSQTKLGCIFFRRRPFSVANVVSLWDSKPLLSGFTDCAGIAGILLFGIFCLSTVFLPRVLNSRQIRNIVYLQTTDMSISTDTLSSLL